MVLSWPPPLVVVAKREVVNQSDRKVTLINHHAGGTRVAPKGATRVRAHVHNRKVVHMCTTHTCMREHARVRARACTSRPEGLAHRSAELTCWPSGLSSATRARARIWEGPADEEKTVASGGTLPPYVTFC